MDGRISQIRVPVWLAGLLLAAVLQACTPAVETLSPLAATLTPIPSPLPASATATLIPSTPTPLPPGETSLPSVTSSATATTEWVPTPFPTSLEAFLYHYDPDAKLEIPPWGSISMLFWGQAIPVEPVFATPEFIPYPTPQGMQHSADRLVELGCELDTWGWGTCPADNPLQGFGCAFLVDPRGRGSGLDPQYPLVAECKIETEEHEAAKINGVYLSGCAFKTENHYIFEIDGEYVLVSSAEQLRELFSPIESPQEAVSYAQLVSGLEAIYSFTYDPYLMYFHETIGGTHVTQAGSAFEMSLFNMQGCGCEPWFTTQITLRVERDGQVSWVEAVPVFMTTGWSCAD